MNDAYAAGLFDGEGWVRISRFEKPNSPHIRYQVMIGLGMTYRPIIEAFAKAYGGSLHENRHDLRNSKARIQFCWVAGSQIACSFLRRIRPYLYVKADEVDIALELQASIDDNKPLLGNRHKLHPDRKKIFAKRETLYRNIMRLKKRSFPSFTD